MITPHLPEISIASTFIVLIILHIILKKKHFFLCSIKELILGLISIVLISIAEPYTGIKIPLNTFSFAISSLMGLPGIGMLAILNTVLS